MRKFFLSVIFTFVIVYSGLWFLISKAVENKTYQYFDQLKKEKSINEYSGNVYITGFPFSFNINLTHPRVKFQKADAHYNTKCDMLFDGTLSIQLRFFSNKIKIKPIGDLHLKGNLNKYNFDYTIGGKDSYYQIHLADSLILSAFKGSIGGIKGRKAQDLVVALVDKVVVHNEDLRMVNKLNNALLFYANKIDFNIGVEGNKDDLEVRYIENLSDAEFHREFHVLSSEVLSLPFARDSVNKIDVNVRNYFDVFSFDKLGKINHKIDLKINMQKNAALVKMNELRLNDAAHNVESTGRIDLNDTNNTNNIDLEFKSTFSELWYELMKIYASRLQLRDLKKQSFGLGNRSIISNIFNAILGFVVNSRTNYSLYVPKLHQMGTIKGNIDIKYKQAKNSFKLNVNTFKIKTDKFTVDANGNAENIGQGKDRYRLKALLVNYSHIVDGLVNYVNRVTQSTGQLFFIAGKKLTISKTTSDRIKFFLREVSDDPTSKSRNLRLTVVNTDGSKCPAVGKYSSKEFCSLWHGFIFNLLLAEITKNLDPTEMLKRLQNPLNLPETVMKDAGKVAEGIVGGLFGGLLGKGQ